MQTSHFRRTWAAAATFVALAGVSSLSLAAKLPPPKLVSNPIVSPNVVDNGQLKTTAPVLGSRSAKPNGGYVLNPVCITSDGVVTGTAEYKYSKWRVNCPDGGKAILNGSDYTTEDKLTVSQRGGLSPASVVVEVPSSSAGASPMPRVLCYGKLANGQTLPGQMSISPANTMPDKCYVKMMGNWVGLQDWGVFKYKNSGLPSQDGWWSPGAGASPSNTAIPLYSYSPRNRNELCRATDPQTNLELPGELVPSTSKYQCRIFASTGFVTVDDFELYVAYTQTSHPLVSTVAQTKAHQPWSSGVRVHDGGTDATRVYACMIPDSERIGWVTKSEGLCRNGHKTATSFKLLMK